MNLVREYYTVSYTRQGTISLYCKLHKTRCHVQIIVKLSGKGGGGARHVSQQLLPKNKEGGWEVPFMFMYTVKIHY